MPEHYAIRKLADVINDGHLGQSRESLHSSPTSTGSNLSDVPTLRTQRGNSTGSFWASRLRLAGAYGWTGIILPDDADTSQPFPISDALLFLVETDVERQLLESLIDSERWQEVKDRVMTIRQLASRLSHS